MALREIFVWPDPILKSKAKPVGEVDASIRKLCDDMAETMYDAHGVGLAAPQIGALQRVIAIDVDQRDTAGDDEVSEAEVQQPKKRKGAGLFFLIDPVLKLGEGEHTYSEGCLSIPDEYEDVTRFGHIIVEFTGRDGRRRELEASNSLLSVCVQHEMDHLEGKLFVDHVSALKRELIRRRMKKLKAQRAAEAAGNATAL